MSGEYNETTQTSIIRKPRQFVDTETGEVIQAEQVFKRVYGQRQFWKLYLYDFLKVLDIFENKQLDVLIFVLENTRPSDNTYIGTYRKIADGCHVSLNTVVKAMNKLQNAKFLHKVQNGVYVVSPDIMMKGSDGKKALLLRYYDTALVHDEEQGEQEESAGPDGPEDSP